MAGTVAGVPGAEAVLRGRDRPRGTCGLAPATEAWAAAALTVATGPGDAAGGARTVETLAGRWRGVVLGGRRTEEVVCRAGAGSD